MQTAMVVRCNSFSFSGLAVPGYANYICLSLACQHYSYRLSMAPQSRHKLKSCQEALAMELRSCSSLITVGDIRTEVLSPFPYLT